MWPFKKKRLYQITWAYDSPATYHYTEIVKAYDAAGAWKKVKRGHGISISLLKLEVLPDV